MCISIRREKLLKSFTKGLAKEESYRDRMLKAEILKSVVEKELQTGWKPTKKICHSLIKIT